MNKSLLSGLLLIVLIFALAWVAWQWFFCRFYVPPNFMAVVVAKTGDALPPGQILAGPREKGVREEVLAEGRHFLNPILYDHQIVEVVTIPAGKVGVVTAKIGQDLPEGEFLAERKQKGIWRGVLGPGKYRLNPYGYQIDVVDAISVPIGYIGVVTSLSGEQAPEGDFAATGQKGIRRDVLQPGLYYINQKELKCDVLEIGVNQVSLLGKTGGEVITKQQIVSQNQAMNELNRNVLAEQQEKRKDYVGRSAAARGRPTFALSEEAEVDKAQRDGRHIPEPKVATATLSLAQLVGFTSRDGFDISLDMTVEFELLPDKIASIYRAYGDLPAVVDKIIMPQILSISRLKGSQYRAKDFIVGEGREKFQSDLTKELADTLREKQIIVHNALIRHVDVPMQILEPIQQASIAVEQDLTNREKQNTARKQAELNTELSLIEQRREQVAQETEKLKAEIKADQEKQVAEIYATAQKLVAEIEKQTAQIRAERTRKLGEAQAQVVTLVDGEKAKGFELRAQAFRDPGAYALWEFVQSLNKDVKINILHAGPGTLWTDLEKATLGTLGGAEVIQTKQK